MEKGRSGSSPGAARAFRNGARPPRRLPIACITVFSVLILTALAGPGRGFPTPGANIGVAVGAGNARSPSLAVDASGNLHLARSDDATGEYGIYYTSSVDGLSWSPSVRVDAPGASSYFPRLAVEREAVPIRDRVYAIYQVGTGPAADIWFTASDGGVTWAPARRVDTAPPNIVSTAPGIAASRGRAYVTWSDNRDPFAYHVFLRASMDGSATWGPEIPLSNAGISNLQSRVEAKDDTVVVVWRQAAPAATSIVTARSEDAGATWSLSVVAVGADATDNLQDPELFLDDLGVAHVVWVHQPASGGSHVRYAWSADGLTWSSPAIVDDMIGDALARYPSVHAVAGTLWVAWVDERSGDNDVFASWSTDGVVWGDGLRNGNDLRVDDTDRNAWPGDDTTTQFAPSLRAAGFGAFVAWEDLRSGATWDLYYAGIDVSPVVITEIQDEPAPAARVELYNFGRVPFTLSGVTLLAGATTVDLSPLGSIPARSHVVIGAPASSDLRAMIDLGSDGARVEVRLGGEVLASAGSGPYGIAPDPLPGESTARFAGTLDYVAAWTRSALPSFRARNLVPPPNLAPRLVLNEVLFNPANSGDRFVEVYLRDATALDLTGYRLVADTVHTFSAYVIGGSNRYGFLAEVRAPSWFGPIDEDGDNVYLYDPGGRLLDMVGWTEPHGLGLGVTRVVPGAGGTRAHDEPSAAANGWAYDRVPTLALVDLESDARVMADIGTTVQFVLTATNIQAVSEHVNILEPSSPPGWSFALLWTNGTPMTDSPGDVDAIPDSGSLGPGATATFLAEVTIPLEGALGDGHAFTVAATAASVPVAGDEVTLSIDLFPHFDISRTVDPATVYLEGSGPPWNEVTQITVVVKGAGFPIVEQVPTDVVFQLDVSGSMNTEDPSNLRVAAVKDYIDNMQVADRASLIGFNSASWVVNNRPLTYATPAGKANLKGDADALACSPSCGGGTNIDDALQLGNNWLILYGDRSRPRIEILLTDGMCTVPVANPCAGTQAIINQAISEGIVIYTIGLGPNVPRAFLEDIANQTGGRYYQANAPQDLQPIYREISLRINRTAGVDPDPTDNVPLIEDDVAPYLTVVPGSFYDPTTGAPRPPSSIQQLGDRTRIQWNVARIEINETWAVRYSATSTRLGVQDVVLHPDARVAYRRWDGSTVFQTIPQERLEVLAPPTPPYITATNPPDGATNVPVNQPVGVVFSEPMDPPTVQWTIAPAVALAPTWSTPRVLVLNHAGLAECAEYTVEVVAGLDTDGDSLIPGPVPNPWSFETVCPTYVRYTITRQPVWGGVLVDGVPYPAPAVFVWVAGTVHEIEAIDFDPAGASRFAFLAWDDGGALDHRVNVGTVDATITATYALQHPATLTLIGLPPSRPATVRSTLFGSDSTVNAATAWSDWVDDGSTVETDRLLVGIPGERFITLDATRWTAAGPLDEVVRYHHQYTATVQLLGLESHEVSVEFVALELEEEGEADVSWSEWVDAGTPVRVPDTLVVDPRERYKTLDETAWTADGPLDEVVVYRHQFRPRVTLLGLDGGHTVGAAWRIDGKDDYADGLEDELFAWADAGTTLRFDAETTGVPTRRAQDPTRLTVNTAFDATIRYAAPAPPARENWKPLLALVYTIGLLVAGAAFSRRTLDRYAPPPKHGTVEARRAAWAKMTVGQKFAELSLAEIEEKVHRDRRFTRLVLLGPSAAAEGAIGVLSYLTGLLRIPEAGEWLPLGFWVNTVLLIAGVTAGIAVWRRGYRMTDDALLRLAESREKARGAEAARAGRGQE